MVLSSTAAALLTGCGPWGPGPSADIPDQASYCSPSFEELFPETREVDLGFGPPSDFVPYAEGDEIETIAGGQGATMITPFVRVEKGVDDGAEPCFRVRVEEGGDVEAFASEWNIQFHEEGDHLSSGGALYFITYTVGDVRLTVTVHGKGFSGTKSVNVVLK
jgi:hypothetical protein